jgi:putative addiction module killer protein
VNYRSQSLGGPGYRVYYIARGAALVMLMCGGDKRTQRQDIELALALKKMLEES